MRNEPGSGRRLTGVPVTRAVKVLLWAGIGASWIAADQACRAPWIERLAMPEGLAAACLIVFIGLGGTLLCVAGMHAVRLAGQREWRESRGRAFTSAGGAVVPAAVAGAPHPAAHGEERLAGCEERLAGCEERLAGCEIKSDLTLDLMRAVTAELGVDTVSVDETCPLPLLRVIDGGRAG